MIKRLSLLLALALAACTTPAPLPTVATLPTQLAPTPAATAAATSLPAATNPPPGATLAPSALPIIDTPSPIPPSPTPTFIPIPSPDPACCQLTPVITGLQNPTIVTQAGDQRLFVIEQRGVIDVFNNGNLQPFLDLQSLVNASGDEMGLLGLAFDPSYASNGFFYVNYTDQSGNTVIARYKVSSDPNQGDPASAQILFTVEQPYPNHNGGNLAFGPDGLLYIGMGDGGSQGDPSGNGQNPNVMLAKMLRLDVNAPNAKPEIWAIGLRNPWRFSFDRQTGDLFIGDVGQDHWEEIDYVSKAGLAQPGPNFGWNILEGTHRYATTGDPAGLTGPIAEYSHNEGGCAVIGGYVYRGAALPALRGSYFLGDFCTGFIWSLTPNAQGQWDRSLFMQSGLAISSFGEDVNGELYIVGRGQGTVYKLVAK